jgi:hypothetical protein
MRAVTKAQGFGRSLQIAAENLTEHSTGDDKVFAISRKIEPVGPRPFIRGEVVEEALNL